MGHEKYNCNGDGNNLADKSGFLAAKDISKSSDDHHEYRHAHEVSRAKHSYLIRFCTLQVKLLDPVF